MRVASLIRAGCRQSGLLICLSKQTHLSAASLLEANKSVFISMRTMCVHSVCSPWHASLTGVLLPLEKVGFMNYQKMLASTTTSQDMIFKGSTTKTKSPQPVIYRGPLSDTLRKVKMLSITSCCLSVITGPAITFLTSPHLSVILKGGIAAAVMILSASTTAALHWFVGPYVHKMVWFPGSKEIEVEMITWMATYDRKSISIEDIRPPKSNRPFVSFAVKDKLYFVDPEKIPNKDLLRLVTFYSNRNQK